MKKIRRRDLLLAGVGASAASRAAAAKPLGGSQRGGAIATPPTTTNAGTRNSFDLAQPDVTGKKMLPDYTPVGVVSGTIPVSVAWAGAPDRGETITYKYQVWGKGPGAGALTMELESPVLTETHLSGDPNSFSLPWSFDSTTAATPDGTKVILPIIQDAVLIPATTYEVTASRPIVVQNHTSAVSQGAGFVVGAARSTQRMCSPRPDGWFYDGVPNPIHATYPIPAFSPTVTFGDVALRNRANWYCISPTGPHVAEYYEVQGYATAWNGSGNPGSGVQITGFEPLAGDSGTVAAAYIPVIALAPMDGTRLNSLLTAFVVFVEDPDPANAGKFWFAEVSGRVGTIDYRDGEVKTVVGFRRDRTQIVFSPVQIDGSTGTAHPDDQEGKFETIGTFSPPTFDLGGANDVCFDPRDSTHRTFYVACQVDNFIAKVSLATTPPTVTIYAGTPGAPNGYVDDPSATSYSNTARFAEPNSLVMDSSGNLYVSEHRNSTIRKIASSVIGTPQGITTAYGGSTWSGWVAHGSIPLTSADMFSAAATFNVTSTSWNSSSSLLTVTMDGAVPAGRIGRGFSMDMSGAINSGGSGDPNIRWIVQDAGFVDSNHFVLGFEKSTINRPSSIGSLTGTITLYNIGADVYSSPTAVLTTSTGGQIIYPSSIRLTHNGNIVLGEGVTGAARLIRLNTLDGGSVGTISRIGCLDNHIDLDPHNLSGGTPGWTWVECNRSGSCGGIDDIVIYKFQGTLNAAHWTWRISLATDAIGQPVYSDKAFSDGSGLPTWSSMDQFIQGGGHYPWGFAFSEHLPLAISTGIAQEGVTIFVGNPSANPIFPPVNFSTNTNIDQARYKRGFAIHLYGTAAGVFPWGARPSFVTSRGWTGASHLLNSAASPPVGGPTDTFEDFMHGSYASTTPGDAGDVALGNYIQAGMGGSVPRPELTGNDLKDYIYFIRRSTMQGSIGPTVQQPPADDPDTVMANISIVSINRTSPTTIAVQWTTDKPAIGIVYGASSAQRALGCFPIFSAIESAYASSGHSMTLTVPPQSLISPVWVSIQAKTVAGIPSYSTEVAVT